MAEYVQKEKFEGTWNGKEVKVTRIWGGHRFTDDECVRLLDGGRVEVTTLSSKVCEGELQDKEYNGHPFVGYEPVEWID